MKKNEKKEPRRERAEDTLVPAYFCHDVSG